MNFEAAATRLRCDVAAIKAVAEVESRNSGFVSGLADGKRYCTILFERHKFSVYTGGKHDGTHPRISNRQPGGYARGITYVHRQHNERKRFSDAYRINPEAAMMSTSWGTFQIMGFNHEACGFVSVGEFVDAMKESAQRHLELVVAFILHEHLDDELREHNWAGFARGYNGKNYRINRYDLKLGQAYARLNRGAA